MKDKIKEISIESQVYKRFEKAYKYALEMTEREVNQAAEGCIHNLNTLQSRSGNQLPFSSVNLGLCTLPEGRMVSKAILNTIINGTGKYGKTSIFPCCIFQYKKGINDKQGTTNYDLYQLALKATSQRLYPNYCNADWSIQKSWVEHDRNLKQGVIDSLSEEDYNKLIEQVEKHPEIAELLNIELVEE